MSIKVTWVAGEIQTVPVSWTSFSIEADVPYDKTLSSASFILTHDDVGQTIYYNDFTMTARATELNPEDEEPIEEEDITYITRDDHSGVLPSSIQHENLTEPYLHEPKAHTHDADEVNITDSGDYFSGTEVETALQELGAVKHASGSDNQNLWATVLSDSGSTTANSQTDTLTVSGSGGINTAVSGDTLTVGIADGAITEAKLDISNAPSDGMVMKYDSTEGKMKWETVSQPAPWTVNNTFQEAPTGSLTTFTVTGDSYTSGGIIVTLNGQILNTTQWSEVTPASGTIEFVTAPLSTDELRWHGAGAGSLGGSSTDELAKVSANDTTAGYLNGKLVAGSNITLTEGNDGGDETLTIASTASGGAWETLYDYTVSGSAISRYLMTVSEATHSSFMLKILFYNGTGTACQNYLYYNNDETDTNYYRQKYYYTGGSLSASQDNNPFIGGVPAGETAVINANIYRPYGNYVVYTESNNMARYTTANQYPRAYVGNGRYVGSAALTKITFVSKASGTEGNYISPGTRITLMGLKI